MAVINKNLRCLCFFLQGKVFCQKRSSIDLLCRCFCSRIYNKKMIHQIIIICQCFRCQIDFRHRDDLRCCCCSLLFRRSFCPDRLNIILLWFRSFCHLRSFFIFSKIHNLRLLRNFRCHSRISIFFTHHLSKISRITLHQLFICLLILSLQIFHGLSFQKTIQRELPEYIFLQRKYSRHNRQNHKYATLQNKIKYLPDL